MIFSLPGVSVRFEGLPDSPQNVAIVCDHQKRGLFHEWELQRDSSPVGGGGPPAPSGCARRALPCCVGTVLKSGC